MLTETVTHRPCSPSAARVAQADGWDVTSWAFGPRRAYRLNALFRAVGGAVVTATGRLDCSSSAAELSAALRPFEELDRAVVVDVYRAVLGGPAVDVLVEAGLRRSRVANGWSVVVVHAGPDTRQLMTRAGGALLLRPRGGPTGW